LLLHTAPRGTLQALFFLWFMSNLLVPPAEQFMGKNAEAVPLCQTAHLADYPPSKHTNTQTSTQTHTYTHTHTNSHTHTNLHLASLPQYTAGTGAVGIVSVLDLKNHEVSMACVGGCHGVVGHAVGSFNQSTAEALNMVQALLSSRCELCVCMCVCELCV
jgi:hypothetical protein